MDDAGAMSVQMTLGDAKVAKKNPYLNAAPCRCFLAVAYTDEQGTETFLAGGPIWTHDYDDTQKFLTIGAAGLWSYYDHRMVLPVLLAGQPAATVTTELVAALGTVAKQLVQLAHTRTGGSVPVAFQADESGTDTRAYNGFDLNTVGQALRDLTTSDNGPEIQFVPRRREDNPRFIEWLMRTGTSAQPLLVQAGADWKWDATRPKSSVSSLSVQRDGSVMATDWWVKGAGSDSGTLIVPASSTTLVDVGYPVLEAELSGHEQESDPDVVSGLGAAALAGSQGPLETWTVKVRRDEKPSVGSYNVGDWVSIIPRGPYLPPGTRRMRILGKSGDDTADVALQLSTIAGSV